MRKKKEKVSQQVIFYVQPSLHEQFVTACEYNYKQLSDVLRELMLDYARKHQVQDVQTAQKFT